MAVTKDENEHGVFDSGMEREIVADRPTFELMLPKGQKYKDTILHRWASLMARGAKKYSARNWEKANTKEERERFKASAFRHFMQWYADENDEDHAAAIFFNVTGAEYVKTKLKPKDL